jgi:hypothetical protein
MLCFNAFGRQDDSPRDPFACSSTFLGHFEHCDGLSLRTTHHERPTVLDERHLTFDLRQLNCQKNMYAPEFIFGADETCRLLYLAPGGVLGEKGAETIKMSRLPVRACPLRCSGPFQQRVTNSHYSSLRRAKLAEGLKGSASGTPRSNRRTVAVVGHRAHAIWPKSRFG